MTPILRACGSRLGWNHRNQNVRLLQWPNVQCSPAAEDGCGTVAGIVVQKRPAAAQFILEVRQTRSGRFAPFVVAATYGQREAVTIRHDNGSRPELDVEWHDLTCIEGLRLVMRVIRPVFGGKHRIELAV